MKKIILFDCIVEGHGHAHGKSFRNRNKDNHATFEHNGDNAVDAVSTEKRQITFVDF